jgi:hypothetical protein
MLQRYIALKLSYSLLETLVLATILLASACEQGQHWATDGFEQTIGSNYLAHFIFVSG